MNIAIIGGGAAGLGAAFLLNRAFDVTLYEAEPTLGGNARTLDFPTSAGPAPVDIGVGLLKPWVYPNIFALFDLLGVSTEAVGVDFGASFGPEDTWITGRLDETPLGRRILGECSRFELDMFRVANLPEDQANQRLGDFARERGYSEEFLEKALVPAMGSLVIVRGSFLDSPVSFVSIVFQHYFSFFAPITWRVIPRGTREYVERLTAGLGGSIRPGVPVAGVTRLSDGVVIRDHLGGEAKFDHVVIATAADTALALLTDASPREAELLTAFEYQATTAYLHSDDSVLSPWLPHDLVSQYSYTGADIGPELRGRFTYRAGLGRGAPDALVTYSWAGSTPPPRNAVAIVEDWKHYAVTTRSFAARGLLHQIQGTNRTWFAGDYHTYPYHEGAFVSGMAVANALGAAYPFADIPLAAQSFEAVRASMFPDQAQP